MGLSDLIPTFYLIGVLKKTIVPFFRSEEDKNLTEDEVQKVKNTADEKKAKYNKARY